MAALLVIERRNGELKPETGGPFDTSEASGGTASEQIGPVARIATIVFTTVKKHVYVNEFKLAPSSFGA